MRKIYFLGAILMVSLTNAQGTIAGWNFNAQSTAATSGVGTLSFVGGTGSPLYINNAGTQALGFADFPTDNVGSGTAGIRFATSTVGYSGISISFDTYGHNQSSKWQRFEYTVDGTNWIILGNNGGTLGSNFAPRTLNFPASCDNNPNFAFRIVSIFNPSGGTVYEQVQGGGYNGSNGKWYFDNVGIGYATLSTKNNAIAGLKMFPNPAKTVLNITSDSFETKTIEIYNVVGAKVMSSKATNSPINIAQLNTGVYMVKITEGQKTATRKLVVE
jgi:Secretion system C-terminal sorting domain